MNDDNCVGMKPAFDEVAGLGMVMATVGLRGAGVTEVTGWVTLRR